MITQTLLDLFADVVVWLLSLIPAWELPSWFGTVMPIWSNAFDMADGFRVWVPFDAIQHVLVFMLATWGVVIGTRVVRIVVSLFTGGGGSAA